MRAILDVCVSGLGEVTWLSGLLGCLLLGSGHTGETDYQQNQPDVDFETIHGSTPKSINDSKSPVGSCASNFQKVKYLEVTVLVLALTGTGNLL